MIRSPNSRRPLACSTRMETVRFVRSMSSCLILLFSSFNHLILRSSAWFEFVWWEIVDLRFFFPAEICWFFRLLMVVLFLSLLNLFEFVSGWKRSIVFIWWWIFLTCVLICDVFFYNFASSSSSLSFVCFWVWVHVQGNAGSSF